MRLLVIRLRFALHKRSYPKQALRPWLECLGGSLNKLQRDTLRRRNPSHSDEAWFCVPEAWWIFWLFVLGIMLIVLAILTPPLNAQVSPGPLSRAHHGSGRSDQLREMSRRVARFSDISLPRLSSGNRRAPEAKARTSPGLYGRTQGVVRTLPFRTQRDQLQPSALGHDPSEGSITLQPASRLTENTQVSPATSVITRAISPESSARAFRRRTSCAPISG